MLPLDIFHSRQFTGANLVTFAVYAALGGAMFLLGLQLQQVLGYSPLEAGAAMFPVTLLMLALSARAGDLSSRIGPRLPMTVGPFGVAVGLALMTQIEAGVGYVTTVLPAVVVFGLGLALTVAPLTTTVLAAADDRHAGIASGVNNAVARVAGLLAIAILPVAAGISGDDYLDPVAFSAGFQTAVGLAAGLAALGGVLAWLTIRNDWLGPGPGGAGARRHLLRAGRLRRCACPGSPRRRSQDAGSPRSRASAERAFSARPSRCSARAATRASSPRARMRTASNPALRAPPTAMVATGTPAGIWAIDSSESRPPRLASGTGTPITGSEVTEASIPGRWAAPPAPAMRTRRPRPAAAWP